MTALSPRIVTEFCRLCGWAYEAWLNHRELFDDNPRATELRDSHVGHAFARLSIVSQEYSLLQVVKLHDYAVVAGKVTLSIDYVLTYGGWSDPILQKLKALAERLEGFAAPLRSARNKVLSHNDLASVLSESQLGAFEKDADIAYFETLQEFVNVVHEEVIGGPWPFNDMVKTDIADLLAAITL